VSAPKLIVDKTCTVYRMSQKRGILLSPYLRQLLIDFKNF